MEGPGASFRQVSCSCGSILQHRCVQSVSSSSSTASSRSRTSTKSALRSSAHLPNGSSSGSQCREHQRGESAARGAQRHSFSWTSVNTLRETDGTWDNGRELCVMSFGRIYGVICNGTRRVQGGANNRKRSRTERTDRTVGPVRLQTGSTRAQAPGRGPFRRYSGRPVFDGR